MRRRLSQKERTIARTVSPENEVNQAMVPNPFPSLSSLRRPPRGEGSASARAGASARRPADAPRALTGGLGAPEPTVQSRNCPSLLLGECLRRSSRFVVAGGERVAGVLLGKRSGSGPAAVRGGSRKALCLKGVSAAFRIRRSFGCWCGVVTPDRIMLAVERAGLDQPAIRPPPSRRRGYGFRVVGGDVPAGQALASRPR